MPTGPSTLETIGVPSTSKAATPPPPSAAEMQSNYAQQLAEVPELASYGPVLSSSIKPSPLTESETEYQVAVVKHIFKEHVVFQVRFRLIAPFVELSSYPIVQRVEHYSGYRPRAGFRHHATASGLESHRKLHYPCSCSYDRYITQHRLRFLHP